MEAMSIFLMLAVGSAWIWHRRVGGFMMATFGATLTAVVLFQVAAFIQAGGWHPLAGVAAGLSAIPAFTVALLVGAVMRWRRRRAG